jgi:hypothetical protein
MSIQRTPYIVFKGYGNSLDLWLRTDPVGAAMSVTRVVLDFGNYQMDSSTSNNITVTERLNEKDEYIYLVIAVPGLEDELPCGDYRCRLIVYNDTGWQDGFVWDDSIEIGVME